MAKGKTPASAAIKAASVAGRALGAVAGRFDALKARYPDPLSEAGRALGKGQAKVRALASEAAATSKAAVAGTKAVLANTTRAAKRARRKGSVERTVEGAVEHCQSPSIGCRDSCEGVSGDVHLELQTPDMR